MDYGATANGLVVCLSLLIFVALIVIYLLWQELPRYVVVVILWQAVLILAGLVGLACGIAEGLVLNGGDSLLIYFPPMIPAAIYVVWASRRAKRKCR